MTIGDIISRLRNTIKEVTGDSVLTNRQLWNIAYTSFLLYNERDKRNIYNSDIFTVVNLEKEEVNFLEDSCVPLECQTCRYALPSGAEGKNGLIYRYIATPDMSETFQLTTPEQYQIKKKIRGNNQKFVFLVGIVYLV